MSGKIEGQDYVCKICKFYERCKDPAYLCEFFTHFEYPKTFRRRYNGLKMRRKDGKKEKT